MRARAHSKRGALGRRPFLRTYIERSVILPTCQSLLAVFVPFLLGAFVPVLLGAFVPFLLGASVPFVLGAFVPFLLGASVPVLLWAFVPFLLGALVPFLPSSLSGRVITSSATRTRRPRRRPSPPASCARCRESRCRSSRRAWRDELARNPSPPPAQPPFHASVDSAQASVAQQTMWMCGSFLQLLFRAFKGFSTLGRNSLHLSAIAPRLVRQRRCRHFLKLREMGYDSDASSVQRGRGVVSPAAGMEGPSRKQVMGWIAAPSRRPI
eukprot:6199389-Pleurochrysis_carterae.AAC.2